MNLGSDITQVAIHSYFLLKMPIFSLHFLHNIAPDLEELRILVHDVEQHAGDVFIKIWSISYHIFCIYFSRIFFSPVDVLPEVSVDILLVLERLPHLEISKY